MAETQRQRENDARRTNDEPGDDSIPRSNYPQGYDETVRRGPPLDTSVATGDYRPGHDNLTGAGVRGYGEPGAYAQWGETDDDDGARAPLGVQGDYAPPSDLPPGYGVPRGYGRLGGWRHGDTGVQRRSGPKNYTRSDDRIQEDVCEHLMDSTDIDPSDVEVRVENGCVTLEGTVPERFMKHYIEDIAAETLGVKEVINNIRVPRTRIEGAEPT